MPGAYTSTPIVVTPPDVPDGWDPDWDFPPPGTPDGGPDGGPYGGPFPPGYEPDYSLGVTAPDSVSIGVPTASVTATLYDHDTYATAEPHGSSITWTATLNGREVMDSVSTNYSASGDFWQYSGDFEFDVTEDDVGKFVVLQATSTVFGEVVSDSANIEVTALIPVSIVTSLVFDSYTINAPSQTKMRLKIERLPSHSSRRDWPQVGATRFGDPEATWWSDDTTYDTLAEFTCSAQHEGEKKIDASGSFLSDSSYRLTYDINEGGNSTVSVTFSVVITMDDGSTLSGEVSHTLVPYSDAEVEYVTVNTESGMVYIFGTRVN